MALKLLILGGTTEANALAARLAGDSRFEAMLSLAGRTASPAPSPIPRRIGGFGGVEGLSRYLSQESIDILVDATHPFAERISANARAAAAATGVPLIAFERPEWEPAPGDRWIRVRGMDEAVAVLTREPSRVLLTVGRQSIAPFAARPEHHYVIRVIDPPEVPAAMTSFEVIAARGPFGVESEIALLREQRIDVLVSKNSGGTAAAAKLTAARTLRVRVIMVARARHDGVAALTDLEAVLAELEHRHAALTKRSL